MNQILGPERGGGGGEKREGGREGGGGEREGEREIMSVCERERDRECY